MLNNLLLTETLGQELYNDAVTRAKVVLGKEDITNEIVMLCAIGLVGYECLDIRKQTELKTELNRVPNFSSIEKYDLETTADSFQTPINAKQKQEQDSQTFKAGYSFAIEKLKNKNWLFRLAAKFLQKEKQRLKFLQ